MTKEMFIQACQKNGIELNEIQIRQFETYMKLLVEWNEKMNLTAITEEEEIWEKHFYDSIVPFGKLEQLSLCDVGSGAGFPGYPLKIVFPSISLTIIEPLQKRCRFLEIVKEELDLKDVTILPKRAEEYARENRECFDIVSARAVARLSVLLELCAPLVKVKGQLIALKGKQGHEELIESGKAIDLLGLQLKQEDTINIEDATRINLYFDKVKKTPLKYPRAFGQIKKKPLGGK